MSENEFELSPSENEDLLSEDELQSERLLSWSYRLPYKANASNPFFAEDFASLLQSVKSYIEKTRACELHLDQNGFGAEELKSILKLLINSNTRVTELKLGFIHFTEETFDAFDLLTKTEINKLDMGASKLPVDEFLYLMELVIDTKITDLNLGILSAKFGASEVERLISSVIASGVTSLDLGGNTFKPKDGVILVEALPHTSVTDLNFSNSHLHYDVLRSLFSLFHHTSITKMDVSMNNINDSLLEILCCNLKASKLQNLNLSCNDISDVGINFLAVGLVHSSVMILDVAGNKFFGNNNLGGCLKDMKVQDLDLSCNRITHSKIFSPPEFLKESSVEKFHLDDCSLGDEVGEKLIWSLQHSSVRYLSLRKNCLGILSFSAFINILKDSQLTELHLQQNGPLSLSELVPFTQSLKSSKLHHISIGGYNMLSSPSAVPLFLRLSEGSPVTSIDLSVSAISECVIVAVADILAETSVKKLLLNSNEIARGVLKFANHLKFSSITHLNVGCNKIDDLGAEALAACLKDTKIINLNLSKNLITNQGAQALAKSLESSNLLSLILDCNQIENDGYKALAESSKNAFMKDLSIKGNPGSRIFLVEKVLLENRIALHYLVNFFNQIAPIKGEIFCFDYIEDSTFSLYLEELLLFCKTLAEQPRAVVALAEEDSISLSKAEILHLIFEVFPPQFSVLVASRLGDNVFAHICLLKRAEELGLSNIVECLLWNRPFYTINEEQDIFHPLVYKLLFKYKQPLYNLAIEPDGRTKIIKYFSSHSDYQDAQFVINLLLTMEGCDKYQNMGLKPKPLKLKSYSGKEYKPSKILGNVEKLAQAKNKSNPMKDPLGLRRSQRIRNNYQSRANITRNPRRSLRNSERRYNLSIANK